MSNIETYYDEFNQPSASKLYKIMKNAGETVTLTLRSRHINLSRRLATSLAPCSICAATTQPQRMAQGGNDAHTRGAVLCVILLPQVC